jgi:ankyrin repeat protein
MSVDPKTQSLFAAITTVNYSQVKLLIEAGVSVNSLNDRGKTPLAVACIQGDLEIVDLLMASGAKMYAQNDVVSPTTSDRSRIVPMTGDWDFTSIEHEVSESPVQNRQIAYEDLIDLIHEPSNNNTDINNRVLTTSVAPTQGQNLSQMAAAWQIESDVDATCTFDLDEVFAANDREIESLDRSSIFVDSEQTMTSLGGSANPIEWEANETYAFDLSKDLLQRAFIQPEIPPHSPSNMGEWAECETYAIDLDNLDGDGSETYAIDLDHLLNSDSSETPRQVEAVSAIEDIDIDDEMFDGTDDFDDSNYDPGATYAIDLDELDSPEPMDGETPTYNFQSDIYPDLDSKRSSIVKPKEPNNIADNFELESKSDLYRQDNISRSGYTPVPERNSPTTSLLAAITGGDIELTRQLVVGMAHLDGYDWDLGYSPLGMAIERGHVEIVKLLLNAGANPHNGSTSTTALGLAAEQGDRETIELLLSSKVDVNAPVAADGWTALLAAIKNGHQSIVQLLVTTGANVNVWSRGETPILLAAKSGERDIYQYLYPLVNTGIRLCANRDGEHLLSATENRQMREQNQLVEKFISLATAGNSAEVRRSIEIGVEIDAIGAGGHNALMAAAYYGHRSIVKILLEAGADPNLLSDGEDGLGYGMSALMFVAGSFFASNRAIIAKLLIAGGADLDLRGAGGKTAMMFAAVAGSGYQACVEILIEAGADLDLRNDRGHTVLTLVAATENYSMFNLLLQAGASTEGLESIQLIQAARSGNVDRVKSLLSNHVNLDLDRGDAIGSAAAAGHTQIVDLLIQAGANVNLSDRSGFTPLASAAYAGYGAICQLLINAGANTQASAGGHDSYSALEYAQMGLRQFPHADRQHAQIIRQLGSVINN